MLKAELAARAAAEERFFYVGLIARDMTQEPSSHGIAEHHQMDKLVKSCRWPWPTKANFFPAPEGLKIALPITGAKKRKNFSEKGR